MLEVQSGIEFLRCFMVLRFPFPMREVSPFSILNISQCLFWLGTDAVLKWQNTAILAAAE